jgi:hypothetical protein
MKVNTLTIRKMGRVYLHGQVGISTEETTKMMREKVMGR